MQFLDDSLLPQLGVSTVSGQRYLTLTFQKRTDAPALTYEVVGSDNLYAPLATWTVQTQAETVAQDAVPEGFVRVKIRDSVSIDSSSTRLYLRLRVTDSEAP